MKTKLSIVLATVLLAGCTFATAVQEGMNRPGGPNHDAWTLEKGVDEMYGAQMWRLYANLKNEARREVGRALFVCSVSDKTVNAAVYFNEVLGSVGDAVELRYKLADGSVMTASGEVYGDGQDMVWITNPQDVQLLADEFITATALLDYHLDSVSSRFDRPLVIVRRSKVVFAASDWRGIEYRLYGGLEDAGAIVEMYKNCGLNIDGSAYTTADNAFTIIRRHFTDRGHDEVAELLDKKAPAVMRRDAERRIGEALDE